MRTFYDIITINVSFWYILIITYLKGAIKMENILFSIFPNKNFIDLGLYQYGWEHCAPAHSFGPSSRNHYLFHYIISGSGTLMANDCKGITQIYQVKSGQGFLIFPKQITTYIADTDDPWEYTWLEFDGLRVKEALNLTDMSLDTPIYNAQSEHFRELMLNEMLHIVQHPHETPFNLIGHLFLFLDYLTRSSKSTHLIQTSKMSDYYIKEAINFIEQNFQNDISIEEIAEICGINRSYLAKIFKKSVGKTPQEFLMNYRMIKATQLLQLTDLSIAEVGRAVSYENQLHFSRAFKTTFGISPRNWRTENKLK